MIDISARARPRARGEPPKSKRFFGEGSAGKTRTGPAVPEAMLSQRRMIIHLLE